MTKRKQKYKEQAIELYKKGYGATYISQQLKVCLRTVQRWLAAYRTTQGDDVVSSLPQSPSVQQLEQPIKTTINPSSGIKRNLLDDLNHILNGQRSCHREMWEALKQKFDDEVHQPDASIRNLNNLSLAIDRHMQGEFKSACQGKQDLMTFQQAFKLLEANGYSIIPQSRSSEFYQSRSERENVI